LSKEVEEFLEHFGVKGMRWGVRKSEPHPLDTKSLPDTVTSKGESLSVVGSKAPALGRGIARLSSRFRDKLARSSHFSLKRKDGTDVGQFYLSRKKDAKELNVVWIEVKDKYAGNGYATAAMKSVIKEAKRQKLDKVTLEVPGISPNARHIYEKLGFKVDKEQSDYNPRDMWGGLTSMTLDLTPKTATHSQTVEEFLEHFGVKGMRWGVRKKPMTAEQKQKAQAKWDKKAKRSFATDYRKASRRMKYEIRSINNKPKYKGKDLSITGPNKALVKEYDTEVGNKTAKVMGTVALGRLGRRPGTGERVTYQYKYAAGDLVMKLSAPRARHDAFSDVMAELESLTFVAKKDAKGFVVDILVLEDESELTQSHLEHYGVKGMRWGVRNEERSADSVRFHAIRKKGSYGKIGKLSNEELQSFITRANLESQYKKVNPTLFKRGAGIVKGLLGVGRTANEVVGFVNSPAGKQMRDAL
jgi:GNAT superfamily N-acetyltransferase